MGNFPKTQISSCFSEIIFPLNLYILKSLVYQWIVKVCPPLKKMGNFYEKLLQKNEIMLYFTL